MSNYSDPLGGTGALPGHRNGNHYVVSRVHDCSAEADGNIASGAAQAMINVPASTLVLAVVTECVVPEGAAAVVDVGDGVDPDGWDIDVNVNSAAGGILGDGAFSAQTAGGKLYTAADTIDITPDADLDTAVIRVTAMMMDVPNGAKFST